MGLLGILIIIAIVVWVNNKNKNNNKRRYDHQQNTQPQYIPQPVQTQDQEQDWTKTYQKTHLLTKNEYYEYKKLKQYADKYNLIICPKVRLLDLVIPRDSRNNLAALGKINSKHVDFVICDDKLYVKGIIEIDDNSHKQQERVERDKFVDSVLRSVGYKVVHTYSVTEETLNCFIEKKETTICTGEDLTLPAGEEN